MAEQMPGHVCVCYEEVVILVTHLLRGTGLLEQLTVVSFLFADFFSLSLFLEVSPLCTLKVIPPPPPPLGPGTPL